MPFTDDDLKRLKMQLDIDIGPNVDLKWTWPSGTLEALIARLEAAEDVILYEGHDFPMKAWRKAAGKNV